MTGEKPSMMSHEEAEGLLPWFVSGTLGKPERAHVSAHVETCLICRRAIQREERLHSLMTAEPMAHAAVDAGFRKLMGRIEKQKRAKARRAMLPDGGVARNTWAYAAMMFVALGVAIWLAKPRETTGPDAPYTAVTDPQPRGDRIDVVFGSDVDAAARAQLIDSVGGRLIAGPSEIGRYTVELMSTDSVDTAVARLRGDERIAFAGRSRADLDSREEPAR